MRNIGRVDERNEMNEILQNFDSHLKRVVDHLSADNFSNLKAFPIPSSMKRFDGNSINPEILVTFAGCKYFHTFWCEFGFETPYEALVFQTELLTRDLYGTLKGMRELELLEMGKKHQNYRKNLKNVVGVLSKNNFQELQKLPIPNDLDFEFNGIFNNKILVYLARNSLFLFHSELFGFEDADQAKEFELMLLSDQNMPFVSELIIRDFMDNFTTKVDGVLGKD